MNTLDDIFVGCIFSLGSRGSFLEQGGRTDSSWQTWKGGRVGQSGLLPGQRLR